MSGSEDNPDPVPSDDTHFDIAVVGTGLPEAITAASLAKRGFSVLQLDQEQYYGGAWASLNLDELFSWAKSRSEPPLASANAYERTQRRAFRDISLRLYSTNDDGDSASSSPGNLPESLKRKSRQYSLSLTPTLLPSSSRFVDTLVSSGVGKYVNFRLLEGVGVYQEGGTIRKVPASKEDVFKDQTLGLVEKRKLMKFLMWAAGGEGRDGIEPATQFLPMLLSPPHSLSPTLSSLILSLSLTPSPTSPALPSLHLLTQTLHSLNKYGASPFLIGQYGGTGEWIGGFARASAVKGAVQVVGRAVGIVELEEEKGWKVRVGDGGDVMEFSAERVVVGAEYAGLLSEDTEKPNAEASAPPEADSRQPIARGLAILPTPLNILPPSPATSTDTEEESNTSEPPQIPENVLVVFPAGSLNAKQTHSVSALITGEGSMSCPSGEQLLYLTTANPSAASPSALLQPALSALLKPTSTTPILSLFYNHHPLSSTNHLAANINIIPNMGRVDDMVPLTATADWATSIAEDTVSKITGKEMWEKEEPSGEDEEVL